jgi:CHASE2 domain-containing sensor protein
MMRSIISWRSALFLSLILTIIVIKPLGRFERLDLLIFDFFYQIRPQEPQDKRVIIVGITEQDIRSAKAYPFSDAYLAKIITKIQNYSPAVLGLDLVRDISVPPGKAKLKDLLKSPNLVTAGTIGVGNDAIAFPPDSRLRGDVSGIEDLDGSVRRFFYNPAVTTLLKILVWRSLWFIFRIKEFTPLPLQMAG